MRTVIILLTLFFAQQFQAQSDNPELVSITVNVDDISSNNGSILFGMYTEGTFLKAAPKFTAKSEIKDGHATAAFENVPKGTYAITCFHDQNDNQQMDFEPTGMPMEPYGVSNNVINMYGPPEWQDAQFEVGDSNLEMNIKISK